MKFSLRSFFLFVGFVVFYPSTIDTFRSIGRWQCSLMKKKSIYDSIVSFQQIYLDEMGRSAWMTEKKNYISCYQKGLLQVPQGLNRKVEILDLQRNAIYVIRKKDFESYQFLEAVLLRENCITNYMFNVPNIPTCPFDYLQIEEGAFSMLSNLIYLDISSNNIEVFPPNLPESLLVLHADYLSIKPVTYKDLQQLESLEMIRLGRNCITGALKYLCKGQFSVDNLRFSSTHLAFLDLCFNNLSTIPTWLLTQNLTTLDLQGNPIHYVYSDDFKNCANLKRLVLSWTSKFDRIPLNISKFALQDLSHLTYLDISGNMLSALPRISANLSDIGLGYNCLRNWTTNPVGLASSQLTAVELLGNTFCDAELYPMKPRTAKFALGKAFQSFTKLESIMFGGHSSKSHLVSQLLFWEMSYGQTYSTLESLKSLRNFSNLNRLSFAVMGIEIVDMSAFCGLNLTLLDLGINEIKTLLPGNQSVVAHQSVSTQRFALILARNSISELPSDVFRCFGEVTELDLSYNSINSLFGGVFRFMNKLVTLDLQFNPIKSFHADCQLVPLQILWLNYTTYQGEFTLNFLLDIQENLTLKYGDVTDHIYRLLSAYRHNGTHFPRVKSIDFSHIPIPVYDILNNRPIFKPFPNLQEIILEEALLTVPLGSCFFEGVRHVTNVTLKNSQIRLFPHQALKTLRKITVLDLSRNEIESLNLTWFNDFPNLTSLDLSNNFICYIEPGAVNRLVDLGLEKLDLNKNLISDVTSSIIDRRAISTLSYLDLRHNMIVCDCSLTETFGWLINSKNTKLHLPGFQPVCSDALNNYYGGCLTCGQASLAHPPSLFSYSLSNICEENFLIILTLSFTVFVMILTFLPLVGRSKSFQQKLVKCLMKNILPQTSQSGGGMSDMFAYDGFICYDNNDSSIAEWVDDVMVPQLEDGDPCLRICIVGKEAWCGMTRVEQLVLRMNASRKTIVLLTENFAQSSQCRYIVSVLEEWMYANGEDRSVIITFTNRLPTRRLLLRHRRCVLKLPNLDDVCDVVVWDMLRELLSRRATD